MKSDVYYLLNTSGRLVRPWMPHGNLKLPKVDVLSMGSGTAVLVPKGLPRNGQIPRQMKIAHC
jgi:hypothetical protein